MKDEYLIYYHFFMESLSLPLIHTIVELHNIPTFTLITENYFTSNNNRQEIYLFPKKFSFRILNVPSPNFDGLLYFWSLFYEGYFLPTELSFWYFWWSWSYLPSLMLQSDQKKTTKRIHMFSYSHSHSPGRMHFLNSPACKSPPILWTRIGCIIK